MNDLVNIKKYVSQRLSTINFLPQFIYNIFEFKESSYLIHWEYFGSNLTTKFLLNHDPPLKKSNFAGINLHSFCGFWLNLQNCVAKVSRIIQSDLSRARPHPFSIAILIYGFWGCLTHPKKSNSQLNGLLRYDGSRILQSEWLRAFRACPSKPEQNSIQNLNHFGASIDVYVHEKSQFYT